MSNQHQVSYLAHLEAHITNWLDALPKKTSLTSVFFGGGTPGMFTTEYEPIMGAIRRFTAPNCEISIEVNPENVSMESCRTWKDLGFNRVSMGVQSFTDRGLETLTRGHGADVAIRSIEILQNTFANINIDLIYGWHKQSSVDWQHDLHLATDLQIPHLSLYALTYEGRTPFARRVRRGVWHEEEDRHEP